MRRTWKLALLMGIALLAARPRPGSGTPDGPSATPHGSRGDGAADDDSRTGAGSGPRAPSSGADLESVFLGIDDAAVQGRPPRSSEGAEGDRLPIPDFDRMSEADRAAYAEFLDGADAMLASINRRIESLNGRVDDLVRGRLLDRIDETVSALTGQARELRGEIHGLADRFELGERRLRQLFPEPPVLKPSTDTDYTGQLSTFQRWGMGIALTFEAVFMAGGVTVPGSHEPHAEQYIQSTSVEGARSSQGASEEAPYRPIDREEPVGSQSVEPAPNAPKPSPSHEEPAQPRGPSSVPTEESRPRSGRKGDKGDGPNGG